MISLVFLLCTKLGCYTVAPELVFATREQCQFVAEQIIRQNQKDTSMPEHEADYICVAWGDSV